MGKIRVLLRVATIAGPTIFRVIKKYGPQLRQILKENPELFSQIQNRVKQFATLRNSGNSGENLLARIAILREQVTHLYATANSVSVAEQAKQWRNELIALEKSVPLLEVMSPKLRATELKEIQYRIDRLSAEILSVTITDEIEDAELDEN
ncbi:MAG: hypothetical protein SPG61_04520 [Arcanobacterium sp.]|nr:hypothetical protein [Arcanobacterium sp.]